MALFYGKHKHSVDSKGRVAIPYAFRGKLSPESEGKIILEPGSDGAISAHPSSEFSKFWEAALPVMTRYQDDSAHALRHLAEIEEVAIDRQGRVLIPRPMLEAAGITNEALLTGAGQHFEIWAPERYEQDRTEKAEARRQALAAAERHVLGMTSEDDTSATGRGAP